MDLVPSPDPAGIPGPAWVFSFLLLFTQTIHAAFMNFTLGGSWFLVWLHVGRQTEWKGRLYDLCMGVLPIAISMTLTFGVAPLLFVQVLYGRFFYTANVLMGWFWLSILSLLVLSFYGVYVLKALAADGESEWLSNSWGRIALHLLIAMGFSSIAFMLTANTALSQSPAIWEEAYLGSTIATILGKVSFFWPRYLHNLVGSLVVAGVWIVWIANLGGRETAEKGGRSGAALAVGASLPQMAIGVWYLFALPESVLNGLFDLKSLASTHLVSGVVVSMILFFNLSLLLVLPTHRKLRWGAAVLASAVLMAMITTSEGIRRLLLQDYLSEPKIVPQSGPLPIFMVLLVLGGLFLAWILRLIWNAREPKTMG
jgi:hypothetical protein